MGHHGKHIIDPETGLCEICDNGAIQEVHHGKRPGKQVFYSNNDDGLTYRSNYDEIPYTKDQYVYDTDDEPTVRYVRKPLYPRPTVRPRRVIYEQPIEQPLVIRRKVVRRDLTPPEEVIIRRPPPPAPRPTAFYYVDKEGQMVPQNNIPPAEPPRRYVVQNKHLPPTRTVRVIRQQARTPPPPASEPWHNGPRRQINSDTEIIERQQRVRHTDSDFYPTTPTKSEMYYIESMPNYNHRSPSDSPTYMSHDNNTPSPKMIYQGDRNRRPTKVEPLPRKIQNQPSPTIVKRVYKNVPPKKYEPSNGEVIPNRKYPPSVRKTETNLPPLRQHRSSPQLTNRNNRSPDSSKTPSIYYIRSTGDYE